MRSVNVSQVFGTNYTPGVANGIDEKGSFEELHPIENELILGPGFVFLGVLDGIEKISATAQIVATSRIDAHRKMFLAQPGSFRHVQAITFDDRRELIER
jgi:hypothetical protein